VAPLAAESQNNQTFHSWVLPRIRLSVEYQSDCKNKTDDLWLGMALEAATEPSSSSQLDYCQLVGESRTSVEVEVTFGVDS